MIFKFNFFKSMHLGKFWVLQPLNSPLNMKIQQNRTNENANSIGNQVNNRKATRMHSNNFCDIWASAESVCTWTIIWMWNLFIVTATNSFCQTKLKATKAGSVTCCCATEQYAAVHIFNILKNARKRKYITATAALVVTFIYSFSLLMLLYRHYFPIHGNTYVISAVNGVANWDRRDKKFKIHIRVVTCQSMNWNLCGNV